MEEWEDIMTEDNRRGILAGKDKDGQDFKAVTYRPKGAKLRWTAKLQKSVAKRKRINGPFASGFDNNLSSSEYRRLAGPPLAPRGLRSRIIDHFYTENGYRTTSRARSGMPLPTGSTSCRRRASASSRYFSQSAIRGAFGPGGEPRCSCRSTSGATN